MKRLLCCGGLLGLTVALLGCNPFVPADTSLISGTPCAPPCWQNLTPGVSTQADVEQFVNNDLLPGEQKTLIIPDPSDSRKIFTWLSARSRVPRWIVVMDDRVTLIDFVPDFSLDMGTVVEHFGPPELLDARSSRFDGAYEEIWLYYPQKGLVFWCDLDMDEISDKIEPGMKVDRVKYFEPGDLANYLIKGEGWTRNGLDLLMRRLKPWPGFTE